MKLLAFTTMIMCATAYNPLGDRLRRMEIVYPDNFRYTMNEVLIGVQPSHKGNLNHDGQDTALETTAEVCFVGGTPNFFKVGHTAIRTIEEKFPEAHMKLGLIEEVKECPSVVGDLLANGRLSYHTWPRGDKNINPETGRTYELDGLVEFFSGCTAALLVPPIEGRVETGELYARAVAIAKVKHAVVLGVQYDEKEYEEKYHEKAPQIAKDAASLYQKMQAVFQEYESNIQILVLHLPMFLENLMYQVQRLKIHKMFFFPLKLDSRLSFVTCRDLGRLAGHALVRFDEVTQALGSSDSQWIDLQWATGTTSPSLLEAALQKIVDKDIQFVPQSTRSYHEELMYHNHMSPESANTVCELYTNIDQDRDIRPSDNTVLTTLGYDAPQDMESWITEHRCCFKSGTRCDHPHAPAAHQPNIPSLSES